MFGTSRGDFAVSVTRFVIVLLIAIVVSACDQDRSPTPAAPSPIVVAPISAPAPPEPPHRITGLVLDSRDAPVSDAALTFHTFRGPVAATSDAAGSFDVTVEPWRGGLEVAVDKMGYEKTNRFVSLGATTSEVHQNLRLHSVLRVAAGQSLRLSINPDDPSCGVDVEYLCRTVRITTRVAGTMMVSVVPDRAESQLLVAMASEMFPRPTTSHLSRVVAENSETQVNVLVWWASKSSGPFTLNTSLVR